MVSMRRVATAGLLALCVTACRARKGGAALAPAESGAAPAASRPPPIDTSWQHDSTRLLAAGDSAPDFEGIGHTGMRVRLSAFLDRPAVVCFYDADGSATAADQVRELRDHWLELAPRVSMVLGVSGDDRIRHRDFATAERLPFLLVADDSGRIARAFGVPLDSGRPRSFAFVVGRDRKILRVIQAPSAGTLVAQILGSVP